MKHWFYNILDHFYQRQKTIILFNETQSHIILSALLFIKYCKFLIPHLYIITNIMTC
jgi:hypothetical protein